MMRGKKEACDRMSEEIRSITEKTALMVDTITTKGTNVLFFSLLAHLGDLSDKTVVETGYVAIFIFPLSAGRWQGQRKLSSVRSHTHANIQFFSVSI